MGIWESFKIAFISIWNHKLRSFLTMLGIIIGVASVIIIVALGEGAKEQIKDELFRTEKNRIELYFEPTPPEGEDEWSFAWEEPTITDEHLMALVSVEGVKAVIAENYAYGNLMVGEQVKDMEIIGVDPGFFTALDIQVVEGRTFTENDSNTSRIVMIDTVARDAFFKENESPIGEIVEIEGNPYKVIGVYESYIPEAYRSENGELLMPRSLVSLMFGSFDVDRVSIIAENIDTLSETGKKAANKLTSLIKPEDGKYVSMSMEDLEAELDAFYGVMTLFIGGIAAISLLVGGIGVMNIMLVSVTERTSEIGLRKAIGASRGKILLQFLIESVTLTSLGGVLGISFAALVAFMISSLTELYAIVNIKVVVIGVLFSAFIGIIFGLLPANKAAKLHPIDALRYE